EVRAVQRVRLDRDAHDVLVEGDGPGQPDVRRRGAHLVRVDHVAAHDGPGGHDAGSQVLRVLVHAGRGDVDRDVTGELYVLLLVPGEHGGGALELLSARVNRWRDLGH